jgi:hypothetical protein
MKSGHLAGYAGDVWYPQPAPPDHPWRHMPRQAMTPHYRWAPGGGEKVGWGEPGGLLMCFRHWAEREPAHR